MTNEFDLTWSALVLLACSVCFLRDFFSNKANLKPIFHHGDVESFLPGQWGDSWEKLKYYLQSLYQERFLYPVVAIIAWHPLCVQ